MERFATEWAEDRERRFRRFVAISAGVHVLALLLVWIAPTPSRSPTSLPAVVRVDLVAMAPSPGKPAPVPSRPKPPEPPTPKVEAPKPKPPPKPRPPTPEKAVLPTEPKMPKPEPRPVEPAAEPEPTPEPELSYEDALDQLRGDDRTRDYEDALDQLRAEASAGRPGPTGGPGVLVSPEEFAWRKRAKLHVTQAWVLDVGFRSQELVTEVEVDLSPDGSVRDVRFARRSGNPWYDEGVERAVRKASPLPPPPDSGAWNFRFSPSDAR